MLGEPIRPAVVRHIPNVTDGSFAGVGPATLQTYLNLPRAYAILHRMPDGRTAAQVVLDQLTLLDSKLEEVAEAVNKNDTDALLANGRFLEDRFGSPSLKLPAAG